jgi:hypothetical protein
MRVFIPSPGFGRWLGASILGGLLLAAVVVAPAQTNGIYREVYAGLGGGGTVSALTNHASFPNAPALDDVLTDGFETPSNIADDYGQRVRALVTAPTTGNYRFYLATDDGGQLYLGTNSTPESRRLIAQVDGWVGIRAYNDTSVQKSAAIPLVAGQRYYLEALMAEGGGGDNLAVAWQLPGGAAPNNGDAPIPASALRPYGLGAPVFLQQPASVAVVEGTTVTFGATLERKFGATYQWTRNGTNLPGATNTSILIAPARLADHGSVFRCLASNLDGSSNSAPATLTVNADTTAPGISDARLLGSPGVLTVRFTELVEPASAAWSGNYTLNGGAAVLSATLLEDGQTVVLRTTPLTAPNYLLYVSNVRDRASTPNTIPANTTRGIVTAYSPLDVSRVTGTNEPAGPSSRRTGLAITEIMYHPTNRPDGRVLEFIEIYNSNPWPEDVGGHRISGTANYTFPLGTSIPALSYRVVATQPADLLAVYGLGGVLGPLTNSTAGNTTNVLDNGGGTLRLRDELDSILIEVAYDDESPWPAAADAAGHSLVLARPSHGEAEAWAWAASERPGGSPGTWDAPTPGTLRTVLINELLAHTDEPQVDFLELFNYSSTSVDLSGCVLTDDPATNKFIVPPGTTIAARGFVSFDSLQLGFALAADGEAVFLKYPDGNRVADAVRFDEQENGVSLGRWPDGAREFRRLATPTAGAANTSPRRSQVVINEVMYHPVSGDDHEEFIELFNRGTNAVDLGAWRLRGGISFNFPAGTTLGAGGYLVIAADRTNLLAAHPALSSALTLGNFSGQLGNGGDTITLQMPDDLVSTNALGQFVTNKLHLAVDSVTYGTGGRWGTWADGGGSSLELREPASDGRLAPNWGDSDETARSDWTTVEFTGLLDLGGMVGADQLHLLLLGAGECLVDNVEVILQGGSNVLPNGGFEGGTAGWYFQGTHEDSRLENGTGYGSNRSLRVVATDRGDTGANRIRAALSQTLAEGTIATLRARVKWLKGHPELLLRLHGNWLEATGPTIATRNLGTPGARNSRFLTNAPPAITDVTHAPILPAANQTITVTASVADSDGLASLVVRYRSDPGTSYTGVLMTYRGAGLYSATLPGLPAGTRLAYYLEAVDTGTPLATSRFPADAPASECLVGFGESVPAGSFGTYRLWVTQTNVTRWSTREKNSNRALDGTFVCGNFRVIYNVGTLYSGSPWHSPGFNSPDGNLCDYEVNLPKDDALLGARDFALATIGNLNSDPSYQAEQTAFWLMRKLGAPYLHRRYVRVFFNGQQRGALYEDSQQPNGEVVSQFFPDDDDGNLHKIEDWFEFNDGGDGFYGNVDATLQNFITAGGAKKTARYRWTWRPRAVRESANQFTNLFELVDAMNATQPEPYRARVAELVDVDCWMRVLAVQRIVGNWDSYGYARGKNMFAYKPRDGAWVLLPWDIDFVMNMGGNPATDPLFGSNEPVLDSFRAFPEFQRAYWRAMEDAVNGPLLPPTLAARLDPRYSSLVANGAAPQSPQGIKDYAAQRRTYILSQLATVAAAFSVAGASDFTTNRNLIALSGTAPIGVKTITVNGAPVAVTWTGVTSWTLAYALTAGTNTLVFGGRDHRGQAVAGATASVTVRYTGTLEAPQDKLVINEVMYHPAVVDAEFIELHNTSTANAFDLSGWRIEGADCDLPLGTILEPGAFAVFAADKSVFAATYGSTIPVAGEFAGKLDNGGETLKLVRPGSTPAGDLIADRVTFDDDPPWPAGADGLGASLQLMDPTQDNNRVANWAAGASGPTNPPVTLLTVTNGWRYQQTANLDGVNWTVPGYNDSGWPSNRALFYVEEAALPEPKHTPLTLGRTTYYFRTHFNFAGIPGTVGLKLRTVLDDGAVFYLNGVEVFRQRLPAGAIGYDTLTTDFVGDAAWEGPFTIPAGSLVAGDNVLAVEVHQTSTGSSDIVFGCDLTTEPAAASAPYTPGAVNSVRTVLPAFPAVWLNEVLPQNVNGITDRFGDRDPWVELYSASTNALSLGGFYLTDTYSNLTKWPFPAAVTLTNRQCLVVWLDGESGESINSELHTSFRLATHAGTVALVWSNAGSVRVLDYLNYSIPSAGRAYGDYPDGNVSGRQEFTVVTPGATNVPTAAPITIFINEWLADNEAGIVAPGSGRQDWFELHNPGGSAVDLSGYFLTDSLTDKTKWAIPASTTIPAHGHLLVWADNHPALNSPGAELHANFALSKNGEAIGLYGAGGVLIDAVTFGAQTTDVSEGRFPDGSATIRAFVTSTPRAENLVVQPNVPPTLDALGNQVLAEGTLLTFSATASDSNQPLQQLTFSLDPGAPDGASIGATNGVFVWIPAEDQGPGTYPITVRVTDSGTPPLSAARSFSVQVNEANRAPVLPTLNARTVEEGVTLSVTAMATDGDWPAQILSYSLDAGAPTGSVIHAQTGVLTWTPSEAQGPGTYPVTVRVTDNGEPPLSATQPLVVTVNEVNLPPVFSPLASVTNHLGATIRIHATATDPDLPANALTYRLGIGAPSGATIDPATGWFEWTPTAVGSRGIALTATDNGAPPLNHIVGFTVKTVAAIQLTGIQFAPASRQIVTWTSLPGRSYQLENSTAADAGWTSLGPPITATGETASATNAVSLGEARFYRVRLAE